MTGKDGASDRSEVLLDARVLEEMRASVRADQFARIIDLFAEDTAARLDRLRDGQPWDDLGALADACHDLASTVGTLGAVLPMMLAREVMAAARAEDRARVDRRLPELIATTGRMTAMLRARYGSTA